MRLMLRVHVYSVIAATLLTSRIIAADLTCDAADSEPLVVPTVDFTDVTSPSTQSAIADTCRTHGLFRPINHGIDAGTMAAALSAHRAVFDVPTADKLSIPIQPGGFTRGFAALGAESGDQSKLECKEAFSYGHEWNINNPLPPANVVNPLQGVNKWASIDKASRDALNKWYRAAVQLSKDVAVGFAQAIDLPTAALEDLCDGGETISLMRLFHYVPAHDASCVNGGPPETVRIGSSPHTDWGFLTVILGDGHGGLQVWHEDAWRELDEAARSEPVVICGDYASMLSGGHLHSPVHRVVLPEESHRASFVFFFYPKYDADFTAAAQKSLEGISSSSGKGQKNVSEGGHGHVNTMLDLVKRDPSALKVTFGEYMRRKWSGVFSGDVANKEDGKD